MEKGKFVRGKEAEQMLPVGEVVFVRLIEPILIKRKSNIIIPGKNNAADGDHLLTDFKHYPLMAEVICVGDEVKKIEAGSIVSFKRSFHKALIAQAVDSILVDGEELKRMNIGDIMSIMPHLRSVILNGKYIDSEYEEAERIINSKNL